MSPTRGRIGLYHCSECKLLAGDQPHGDSITDNNRGTHANAITHPDINAGGRVNIQSKMNRLTKYTSCNCHRRIGDYRFPTRLLRELR